MKYLILGFFLVALSLFLSGQTNAQKMPPNADAKLWARALKIHKSAIIVDGHNDITTAMADEDFDIGTDSQGKTHFDGDLETPGVVNYQTDLARLRQSGITGEFFSLYVSGDYAKAGGSMRHALDQIDATYRAVENYPNQLNFCATAADIIRAKKQNKICALMGIEGGHAIENSLAALREFYRLGVRYMTLTHNNTNDWADSNRAAQEKHNGLTDFGKRVVREMNRLGMLVDVAHVSDKTMSDVLDVTTAPVIASHSSVRAIANQPRNIPDDLIKRIAANKGIIMINFYPAFLDQKYIDETKARDERLKPNIEQLKEQFKDDKKSFDTAQKKLLAENPVALPSYTKIVDHIDYIKNLVGVDFIGIGSDFDGIDVLPEPMTGAESLPLVTYEMLRRGYTETEIKKVLGGNFLRVFTAVENVAKTSSRKISGAGDLTKIK